MSLVQIYDKDQFMKNWWEAANKKNENRKYDGNGFRTYAGTLKQYTDSGYFGSDLINYSKEKLELHYYLFEDGNQTSLYYYNPV